METLVKPSHTFFIKGLLIEIICYLHVIMFIYAGVYKLLDYHFFVITLSRSPLIGGMAELIAWLVPLLEIAVAVMLLLKRTRLMGLYLSLVIMSTFTIYIAYLLFFAPEVPCACGGILEMMGWKAHFIFNSCFVLMAIAAIIMETHLRRMRS